MHVGARYYDPLVGRFVQADTWLGEVGNPQSLNRYVYVENDPVNSVDPSGHQKKKGKPIGIDVKGKIPLFKLGPFLIGAEVNTKDGAIFITVEPTKGGKGEKPKPSPIDIGGIIKNLPPGSTVVISPDGTITITVGGGGGGQPPGGGDDEDWP
jgi:hypothetical protein